MESETKDLQTDAETDLTPIPAELAAKIDFIAIGTPLIRAGRRITPVHPMTKMGVMRNWNIHQITTIRELTALAKYYPHHNVGCVGKRGSRCDSATGKEIGNDCFLDIDAGGVLERIESETGHKMPATYTVCTRPQSNRNKQHFYFRQTAHSIRTFKKNINVKNLTTFDEEGNHPTLYDLKGIGGASFVVGAGSLRDNGEIYTLTDNSPVADIPDWLVDWVYKDHAKYRAAVAIENERKRAVKASERQRFSPKQRAAMRKEGLPEGFDIYQADTYDFLRYKARQLASHGLISSLEPALAELASEFCVAGREYAHSERGKATIAKIANDPDLRRGHAELFYARKDKADLVSGLKIYEPNTVRKQLVGAIKKFPDAIMADEAWVELEKKFGVNRKSLKDRSAVGKARKKAGFTTRNVGGRYQWMRKQK
jgi:hypothetical protein